MRSVILSIVLATGLSACATVSMVGSEATVETDILQEQSSLRKVSDAYIELAESKQWVQKSKGLLDFARVLMDGSNADDASKPADYTALVVRDAPTRQAQMNLIRDDIEGAAHGLDVATMEAEKLFDTDAAAKALRADLVSYESALVTAKQARRTFLSTLGDLDLNTGNMASYALAELDLSIDSARDTADRLADFAADRKSSEALF
ncbi:MAG: hypothetical protein AAGA72_07150 [Pseudomonadota bacterium]